MAHTINNLQHFTPEGILNKVLTTLHARRHTGFEGRERERDKPAKMIGLLNPVGCFKRFK
jgi:hypothetical protein